MHSTFKILLLIFLSWNLATEPTGDIEVVIEGLQSTEELLRIAIYPSADGFPNNLNKATQKFNLRFSECPLKFTFSELPYSEYAISAFHDENENRKFDMTWYFKALEDYGTSKDARGMFGPPKFEDAKFKLDSPNLQIPIKMVY